MVLKFFACFLAMAVVGQMVFALPTSLLEETKSFNARQKVKRSSQQSGHESVGLGDHATVAATKNPAVKKRAGKPYDLREDPRTWDDPEVIYDVSNAMDASPYAMDLYGPDSGDTYVPDKMNDYYRDSQYVPSQKLEELIKSGGELFGNAPMLSDYRYYGNEDRRRKRSVGGEKKKLKNRNKRELDLNPEDVLALLSIWETERGHNQAYNRNAPYDYEEMDDSNEIEDGDDGFLDAPVYPSARGGGRFAMHGSKVPSAYYYDTTDYQNLAKRQQKRFKVARRSSDPTRELRYFSSGSPGSRSGAAHVAVSPNGDDNIYTLAQLLNGSQQRDPNVPLYRRMML